MSGMKITDEQLLESIWQNQMRCLSDGVIDQYVGNKFGLGSDNEHQYFNASSEHIAHRQRLTNAISKQRLRIRIKKLLDEGKLNTAYKHTLLTFFIDSEEAKEAFHAARSFWLENGVPEGGNETRSMKTTKMTTAEFESLREQCSEMLLERFGGIYQ